MHQEIEEKNPIIFIRMTTGEDVLTEFHTANNLYYFKNPLKVVYGLTPKQDGMIITLAQWVFDTICVNQEFNVKLSDILIMGEPTKEMVAYYHEAIERNTTKPQKLKSMSRREIDSPSEDEEYEEISDEEMEMLKNVLDGLKVDKRKLH